MRRRVDRFSRVFRGRDGGKIRAELTAPVKPTLDGLTPYGMLTVDHKAAVKAGDVVSDGHLQLLLANEQQLAHVARFLAFEVTATVRYETRSVVTDTLTGLEKEAGYQLVDATLPIVEVPHEFFVDQGLESPRSIILAGRALAPGDRINGRVVQVVEFIRGVSRAIIQ